MTQPHAATATSTYVYGTPGQTPPRQTLDRHCQTPARHTPGRHCCALEDTAMECYYSLHLKKVFARFLGVLHSHTILFYFSTNLA